MTCLSQGLSFLLSLALMVTTWLQEFQASHLHSWQEEREVGGLPQLSLLIGKKIKAFPETSNGRLFPTLCWLALCHMAIPCIKKNCKITCLFHVFRLCTRRDKGLGMAIRPGNLRGLPRLERVNGKQNKNEHVNNKHLKAKQIWCTTYHVGFSPSLVCRFSSLAAR